jgi:hydroxypyruvate isomerase
MKLSICINSVTGTLPRTVAIRYAKQLGYPAVEFWEGINFPVDEFKTVLDDTGLDVACMGMAPNLGDPNGLENTTHNVKTSLANAQKLGAKCIIATTGQELEGVSREVQRKAIVDNLKAAADIVSGTGIKLILEPLNILVDHKGYFLSRSDEAFGLLREVNSSDIKLLFDIYHQQITEGNLIRNIVDNIDLIGHFHVAGNPGRNEPYHGEINYSEVFDAADEAGYKGYAGLEYWHKHDDMEKSLLKCLELYG